jgi:hypothetical protein
MTDKKKPVYLNAEEMKFAALVAETLTTLVGKGDTWFGNFTVPSAQIAFEGDESVRVVYIDDEYQIEVTQ